jgi:hypothetical protein
LKQIQFFGLPTGENLVVRFEVFRYIEGIPDHSNYDLLSPTTSNTPSQSLDGKGIISDLIKKGVNTGK